MAVVTVVARAGAGLALGAASAFAELPYAVLGGALLAVPGARNAVGRGARALTEFERRRLATYLGTESASDYSETRALGYLGARSIAGGLGAGIFLLIAYGLYIGATALWQLAVSGRFSATGDPDGLDWYDPIAFVLLGVLLAFIAVQGLLGVAALDRGLANRMLGPSREELLRRRVSELATTRAEVIEAVNEERRRIERALHDGVQQRLVALGMLLGRARRTDEPGELLQQAHEQSQEALRDLREVSWRVYPVALDAGGLHAALEVVAERASVPVDLDYALADRPDPATETIAYFVVSEAVANALKHASASLIAIGIAKQGTMITVRITDDGRGGAALSGGGLSGLARRVAAADGEFTVDSPDGGPTTVTAVLPCA
ncbi:sensor histidine kinase [Amycolatopsis sp. CA-230715]|uniref:sensor histidine kinase n=1 Tax=Amycolatopsis sp. CA-230715 TaxID=2745196 RepID=UPI001C0225C2|nr:histidine kinase [Amycolatopsis sp. CA-230715]QWF79730.1 hypothetical protein HUW46_03142 [Amycolatopsis sp. CA-230715]